MKVKPFKLKYKASDFTIQTGNDTGDARVYATINSKDNRIRETPMKTFMESQSS